MLRGFLDYRGFTNKSKKHKIYKIRVILFTYEVRVNQEMILELKHYSNISSVTCNCASLYLKMDKNYTRQLVGPHLEKISWIETLNFRR